MNFEAVAAEMAGKLTANAGLRAFGYPVATLPMPGAVVGMPDDVTFDQTYGRGSDVATFTVWAMVPRSDERSAALAVLAFVSGSGPKSVKAALDSTDTNTYTSCDEVTVATATTGAYTYSGVDAFGAEFTVHVAGRGGA